MSATTPDNAPDSTPGGPRLFLPGESLSPSAGIHWIGQGWALFKRAPLMWIVMIVLLVVVALVMAFIPIIGQLAFQILTPVIAAGFVVGCWSLENNGELEIEHLIAGFQRNFGKLVLVGVLYLVGGIVIMIVGMLFMGASILPMLLSGAAATSDVDLAAAALGTAGLMFWMGILVAMGLGLLLVAAYWFAPALVVMHGMNALDAMKASFFACFRNFIPFLVYGIAMLVLLIPVALTLGLGILVYIPVAIASTYRAYRQIFTEE